VAVIDNYFKKHNLQQPTFDVDSPKELPSDVNVQRAWMLLIEKVSAVANLATGAADHLLWHQMTVSRSTGLNRQKRTNPENRKGMMAPPCIS
jgi:hypothetical protein